MSKVVRVGGSQGEISSGAFAKVRVTRVGAADSRPAPSSDPQRTPGLEKRLEALEKRVSELEALVIEHGWLEGDTESDPEPAKPNAVDTDPPST